MSELESRSRSAGLALLFPSPEFSRMGSTRRASVRPRLGAGASSNSFRCRSDSTVRMLAVVKVRWSVLAIAGSSSRSQSNPCWPARILDSCLTKAGMMMGSPRGTGASCGGIDAVDRSRWSGCREEAAAPSALPWEPAVPTWVGSTGDDILKDLSWVCRRRDGQLRSPFGDHLHSQSLLLAIGFAADKLGQLSAMRDGPRAIGKRVNGRAGNPAARV